MTKPTMTSQWDPGNYKPLDMSNIPGYPQQMPFEYINLLPGFTGGDRERADYHMRNFWNFFLSYPVDDYAEDVVMKLFSTTLSHNAKEWYDNLPDASITTMEQFEKTFLEEWGIQLEDIPTLLKELEHIKQAEDETVRDFQIKFENMLYQIPESHHPEERYLVHLFTRALLGYLSFPLDKITPRTLDEAYYMAAVIEEKISSFDIGCLFTLSTLNGENLFTLESFIIDLQEEGEQTTDRRGIVEEIVEERNPITKYQHALFLLMKRSISLLHLHNNKTIRLVSFLFRILMIPYFMIQRVMEKWNPRMKSIFLAARPRIRQ
jgi:hypothetical protein